MRHLNKIFFLIFLLAGTVAGGVWWWASQPLRLDHSPLDFRIIAGSSLRSAIGQIQEAGVDVHPSLLSLLARVRLAETGIKAGSYSIKRGVTPLQLLEKLTQGKVTLGQVTLVEGLTFKQWRAKLDSHPDLIHETQNLTEAEIIERLGLPVARLDGWLFSDTYLFDKQSTDLELIARAERTMQYKLEDEWAGRAEGLPYKTRHDALVMASIVEKETGLEADRTLVAAVFVNRLRKGMLLQTDPTVIYGLGEGFDGNLRKRDLQTDTPYNTYMRFGLPPTPIAMPGLASLRAALHPAPSDVLYFVARGDGSSEFSRTLDEHNRAVNKYQRGGK
ncbi:MAG TPA: endolytic transglycosylase MltG [Azonexus sp.]|nr:endolytic transglycosylase MltG [Azonexus sp.]